MDGMAMGILRVSFLQWLSLLHRTRKAEVGLPVITVHMVTDAPEVRAALEEVGN